MNQFQLQTQKKANKIKNLYKTNIHPNQINNLFSLHAFKIQQKLNIKKLSYDSKV